MINTNSKLLPKTSNSSVNIAEQIDAVGVSSPNAPAIEYQGTVCTYAALAKQSELLANKIQSLLNNFSKRIVAVYLPHCIDLPIAILGAIKAGAAYLPLDPSYPPQRLQWMVQDACPDVIVTTSDFSETVAALAVNSQIIELDHLHAEQEVASIRQKQEAKQSELAYIIYTSGSTGTPKGVMVSNKSLIHAIEAFQTIFKLNSSDRFYSITPISFDIFALELFLPLTQGACCILGAQEERTNPELLNKKLQDSKATFIQATPATFEMLIQSDWKNNLLRGILCGGEAWSIALSKKMAECIDADCRIWNMYGPTEATIWCACQEIERDSTSVKIGKPITGNEFFLLRENNIVDDEGELCIAGANLSDGYLNSEQTAARFIPHPTNARKTIYKTGDWVKRTDDLYEFRSRIDRQIKLRGYRIELGEIESKLNSYPGIIRSAITFNKEDSNPRLKAYLICSHDFDEKQLSYFLKENLPSYMIPAEFEKLKEFPLTPAGKIDYDLMNKLDAERPQTVATIDQKEDAETVASKIKTLWKSLLKIDQVEDNAHFIELGGHSLLIVRLASQIRKTLAVEISLPDLVQRLHLNSMIEFVSQQKHKTSDQSNALPIKNTGGKTKRHELTFEQQDNWQYDRDLGASLAVTSPAAICINGPLSSSRLEKAFRKVLEGNTVFQYRFYQDGKIFYQEKCEPKPFALRVRDTYSDKDAIEIAEQFILNDHHEKLNLEQPYLFHAELLKVSDTKHVLITFNHHIIMDGWAKSVFFDEVAKCYRELEKNDEFQYQENTSYDAYMEYYHAWQTSEEAKKQEDFWKGFIAHKPESTVLTPGVIATHEHKETFAGDVTWFPIANEDILKLEQFAKENRITIYSCMLTCFYLTLASYNNKNIQTIGTVAFGRTNKQFESTLGLLANTLLIQANFSEKSIGEFIKEVNNKALMAIANQDLPFGRILELANTNTDTNLSRPGNVLFLFQNILPRVLDLGKSIQSEFLKVKSKHSLLDLLFEIRCDQSGKLFGAIEYQTRLFDQVFIEQLIKRYQACIKLILDDTSKDSWELVRKIKNEI